MAEMTLEASPRSVATGVNWIVVVKAAIILLVVVGGPMLLGVFWSLRLLTAAYALSAISNFLFAFVVMAFAAAEMKVEGDGSAVDLGERVIHIVCALFIYGWGLAVTLTLLGRGFHDLINAFHLGT
jgi:hypothetical protein